MSGDGFREEERSEREGRKEERKRGGGEVLDRIWFD